MNENLKISNRSINILTKIKKFLENENLIPILRNIQLNSKKNNGNVNPFKILISTILSVRNRDEMTSIAIKKLFDEAKLDTPQKIIDAPIELIQELIKKSGMYKTKAVRIKQASRFLIDKFNGKVPQNMDELLKIPGVGRKVANCVRVYAFNIPSIPVDTHVHRIMNRIGLVKTKKPEETENELMKIFPQSYWLDINDTMVIFGKSICTPISPKCLKCPIMQECQKLIEKKTKKIKSK